MNERNMCTKGYSCALERKYVDEPIEWVHHLISTWLIMKMTMSGLLFKSSGHKLTTT